MNDQKPNLLRAERHGYTRLLEWDELTAEGLKAAILDSMESKEMQEALERVHRLYTDREKKPVEKAVWWIDEYGRPGLEPETPGYQPTEEDLGELEKHLRALLQG